MPAATVDHSQRICEVWACNLDEEMKKIRQVIRKYNYVAMVSGKLTFTILE
uniref:CCR4-NOT transcription complex subunit 7 n=1 Tax=Ficedula albicollis TaxID=59894 RepID=A0A803VX01_FICAL